jgi:hypothetical protein
MKQYCDHRNAEHIRSEMQPARISRRAAMGSSATAFLGLLSGTVLAQGGADSEAAREARERAVERAREAARMAGEATLQQRYGQQDSDFFESMRTSDVETRAKMMRDWQSQRMLERLKAELKVSEEEWTVIKPRVEAVYRLMHTQSSATDDETEVSVAQRITELRQLLALPEAKPEAIKARLTLLRAAREQVQQKLIGVHGTPYCSVQSNLVSRVPRPNSFGCVLRMSRIGRKSTVKQV